MEPVRGQDDRTRERHAGMACGSRPVERIPELGAFPTAGTPPRPGIVKGRVIAPLPAPANGRLAKRPSRQGGTDKPEFRF